MLVRGLAHEIKNPLGGIRGAAQLLARQLPDESLRDYTNVIIGHGQRWQFVRAQHAIHQIAQAVGFFNDHVGVVAQAFVGVFVVRASDGAFSGVSDGCMRGANRRE